MPPTVATISNVAQRVIAILNANPGVWTNTVSGTVGAFPDTAEIHQAALEADGELITKGYFNSINNALAEPFMAYSDPLRQATRIPTHYGNLGKVQLSTTNSSLVSSVNATSNVITVAKAPANGAPVSFYIAAGGVLPGGITAGTTYYAIRLSATTFQIATTPANSYAGAPVVDLTDVGTTPFGYIEWQSGVEAQNMDDVINAALAVADSYVESGALNYIYKIADNTIFHATDWGRVETPQYNRTTALQANQADEPIIIALTVKLLTKNASPAFFEQWTRFADQGMQAILRDGSYQPENPDGNL